MAGKGLQDLGLKDEKLPEQTFDDLPEFGGFAPPPQPGAYRWRLPSSGVLARAWETVDTDKGQRLKLLLDKDAPLTIVQSPGGKINGDTFQTRLTTQERKRGKDGPEASDIDYLLKAFGEKSRPPSQKAIADKVISFGDKEFGSDLEYSYRCDPNRDIYAKGEDGKAVKVDGTKGCGAKYYQKDVADMRGENGEYPHEILCTCGALVRAFANLTNFRA